MSLFLIIALSLLAAVVVTAFIFVIKSIAAPKKLSNIKKLLKDGKISQAQRIAKGIIAKNPRDFVAHYWLGQAYLADNKPELAFMEYKTVNENALFNGEIPEVEFRKEMAELYSRYNQPEDALKEYLLLTKMEPQNADNDYNVGKIYENMGKGSMAMGFYQKAISANKKHAKAHTAMGYLLFRSKQYTDAKKEIDTAIRLSPEEFSNYYYLGKILKENQDYSSAVKAFEKAERDPDFRQKALIERGSCFMAVTQVDNAMGEFEHAIKCSKNDSSQETLYARYFLAACYEKTRKIEKAIEQWEIIFQKNKGFRDVASKLHEYKELQSNDNMKEYLTSSSAQFIEICKKAAQTGFNLVSQKTEETKSGCIMLCTEDKKDNWMNVRQQIIFVQFFRVTDPIEDTVIRKAADLLKAQNYAKAVIITSSEFTRSAVSFADTRPVILVDKEKLESILSKTKL